MVNNKLNYTVCFDAEDWEVRQKDMVLTKYLLILLDKPNVKFEVLELYKLTQVQNVEEVIRRYYDDNLKVLPAKAYCSLVFLNNTYEEFNSLIEYIYEYVL